MRKHLQIALMASPVIATFLSITTPQLQAQAGFGTAASITTATDDSGRKIYVNDVGAGGAEEGHRLQRCEPAGSSTGVRRRINGNRFRQPISVQHARRRLK